MTHFFHTKLTLAKGLGRSWGVFEFANQMMILLCWGRGMLGKICRFLLSDFRKFDAMSFFGCLKSNRLSNIRT